MKIRVNIAASALALCTAPALADTPASAVQTGPTPFDQEARTRQVASGDLRLPPLDPAQITPEMRALAKQMQAFFRSKGRVAPKNNAATYRHPTLLYNQTKLGLDLNRYGTLPPRQREMIILRTAWLVRSPFEWGEHVTFGKYLGLTSEEIERITQGSSAQGWNEHDAAVLRGVEELLGDHAISDATWAVLAKSWNEQQLIELPGLVGSYTLTAMMFNSLRVGMLPDNHGFAAR
jgi:4-carboxymuconolactone decarboxylase